MRDTSVESVAVGFFDGVHVGHRAILSRAERVFTFSNHPLSVLAPERAPRLIMPPAAKVEAIRACSAAEVEMMEFTKATALLSPDEFAEAYLAGGSRRRPRIICGENWRFGAGARGDAELLRSMGFEVEVVPYAVVGGEPVSSSRIRRCLASGELDRVGAMIGRCYSLAGRTFRGKGMGARIGFPTLNVRMPDGFVPPLALGVYEVCVRGVTGVANVGTAPTLGADSWPQPVLEVHFPGCSQRELPFAAQDGLLEVSFIRFIRPERAFGSMEELTRQIAADCASVSHA